jgi:hypothetical protein
MGIFNNLKSYFSLSSDINKLKKEDTQEMGVISDTLPELTLDMTDEELLALARAWKIKWDSASKELIKKQEDNQNYWLGKQYSDVEEAQEERPLVDNLIFESIETFLPVAVKQSPEPVVEVDETPEGEKLIKLITSRLRFLFDNLKIRLKVRQAVRFWALHYFGALKVGWNMIDDEIDVQNIKSKNLILDPDAQIVGGKYCGEFLGEIKKEPASNLLKRFPNKKLFIEGLCGKEGQGTTLQYIEWWTDEAVFWQLKGEILDKIKNPHFNYGTEEVIVKDISALEVTDSDIQPEQTETVKKSGQNHFKTPRIPYSFLTVYNLLEHPWDDTSLIEQNLALQDLINKRQRQLDINIDDINGGWIVSGDSGLNKEQATQFIRTARKGGGLYISTGNPNNVVAKIVGSGLPSDVYNSLVDYRNELRGVFGVTGIIPQGIQNERTVRGKIITRSADIDRIGGGIAECIEQFVDYTYNLIIQMMYVYYTEQRKWTFIEDGKNVPMTLDNQMFADKNILVSVKEGSLLPKDSLTQRNEAIDLWSAQAIDPLTLYEKLSLPDPKKAFERLINWQSNPTGLLQGTPVTTPQQSQDVINQIPIQ